MVETGEEEEQEYESDPEEAPLPFTMRRREASDDEEGEEEEEDSRMDRRRGVVDHSDGESDGQGGVDEEYEDEETEIEEEEEDIEEEEEEYVVGRQRVVSGNDGLEVSDDVLESGGGDKGDGEGEESVDKIEGEGEKKKNEPFAVPTAGAFYMHDDRFPESNGGGGRHRRTLGGRKLWESKDDRKWGHDKFEELNSQETKNDKEGKRCASRGRGKKRGADRGYVRANRPRNYDDGNNQNSVPKSVKGRGPSRYLASARNNGDTPPNHNKQSGRTYETPMNNNNSGRISNHTHQNAQSNPAAPRKQVFASSLSSASPPFYPSGSSNQDVIVTQKRDVQAGGSNRNVSAVFTEEKLSMPNGNSLARGKSVTDLIGKGRQYINAPVRPLTGKFSNMQLQSSGSPTGSNQSLQYRPKGGSSEIVARHNYQSTSSPNHGKRGTVQYTVVQQKPVIPAQPLRVSTQQMAQHPGSGSQASSPPKASSTNSSEPEETESPTGSSKSKIALVSKGKGSAQGSGRGTFLYNGVQVGAAGNMGVAHGDQKYPVTPALLPVMQFGGQHNGGLGVPAVGMALPGYVAQPQLGFGNSEMTWVPVLANAASAVGAPYCSPYLPVDGGYYARQSGQTSSSGASSRDVSTNKQNIEWKPPAERPELVSDEFGQRQNKPRTRYSEMSFGQ